MRTVDTVKKAKLLSVVRGYERKKRVNKEKRVDFTVSPCDSDEKILIRAITQTKSHSGYIGVDTVREMDDFLKKNSYNKGIIIGDKFTNSARKEVNDAGIELLSGSLSSKFTTKKLYSKITAYIEKMCKTKCGKLPENESDCKGIVDGDYKCKIRLISDNADFHFEKMWKDFLTRDLTQLIELEKKMD